MVTKKNSLCLFCSLGCAFGIRSDGGMDYQGALCPRGHYNLEMLNHPARLTEPQIGRRQVPWEEAIAFIKRELKRLKPEQIGIVLSSLASNEDAQQVAALANELGTRNLCAAGSLADEAAYRGIILEVPGAEPATLADIEKSSALLIVGDILVRAPVLSKKINTVKYGKRGNQILVIDPVRSHTAWFATQHLQNRPGTEALVLAAMLQIITKGSIDLENAAELTGIPEDKIVAAARAFDAAVGTIIFVPGPNKQRNDLISYFIKQLAAASAGKKYVVFYLYSNTPGVNAVLDQQLPSHLSIAEMQAKIDRGEIQALLQLGENMLIEKQRPIKFVAQAAYFPVGSGVDVVLPLASQLESHGSYVMAGGRVETVTPAAPAVGSKTSGEIAALLTDKKNISSSVAPVARSEKADLAAKIAELSAVSVQSESSPEAVTDFGDNALVSNFFWYRVNNKNG